MSIKAKGTEKVMSSRVVSSNKNMKIGEWGAQNGKQRLINEV